ncbi:MAG TPA: hypothetical protein VIM79_21520 [Niastella sp.]
MAWGLAVWANKEAGSKAAAININFCINNFGCVTLRNFEQVCNRFAHINDLPAYEEEVETYRYIIDELQKPEILCIHLSALVAHGSSSIPTEFIKDVRARFGNPLCCRARGV